MNLKKISALSLIASISLIASDLSQEQLLQKIKNIGIFKAPTLEIKNVLDNDSIFHVSGINKIQNGQQMPIEAFVTKDFKYVILGKGFDADSGESMHIPVDMSKYSDKIKISMGTGDKELYLFTDPECPYCVDLEKKIIKSKEDIFKKYKINIILYPLPFHKNAKDMSYYILSQKDKVKAMEHIMGENGEKYKDAKYSTRELQNLNTIIEDQIAISQEIGIEGTPTLIDSTGKRVNPGFLFQK